MVYDIVLWILLGALAGWIGSMIMKTNAQMGALANIIVGILGAFIGGFLFRIMTGNNVNNLSIGGLIVAILGSIILLAIAKAATRTHHVAE